MRILKSVPPIALIACASCTGDHAPPLTVVDSAGVQIVQVTNFGDNADKVKQRLYAEAVAVPLGAEHDFTAVTAARLIRGHIATVASGYQPRLLLIDSTGMLMRDLGRPGDGPGEFRDIGMLLPSQESVVVYDRRLRRLTSFRLTGELLGADDAASTFGGAPGVAFAYPRGDTLLILRLRRPSSDGHVRPLASVQSYVGGRLLRELEPLQGTEEFIQRRGPATRSLPIPFGRRLIVYPSPDGVVIADTETAEARSYDFGLQLQRIIRVDVVPRRLTSRDLGRHIDSVLAPYRDPVVRRASEDGIRSRHVHSKGPAIAELIVGNTGEVWWRLDHNDAGGSHFYYVFQRDGTFCCRVNVGSVVRLLDATEEAMLVVRRGEGGRDDLVLMKRSQEEAPD